MRAGWQARRCRSSSSRSWRRRGRSGCLRGPDIGLDPAATGRFPFHRVRSKQGNSYVADKTAQTIYIDAEPSTVMDVIADIGSYPDWVAEYKETEVLEVDDEGYPARARLRLDAKVLNDTMELAYVWPADRNSVTWTLVSSTLLRSLEGAYRLSPKGSGTDV